MLILMPNDSMLHPLNINEIILMISLKRFRVTSTRTSTMSTTSQWLSSLASAGGLLTDNECSMLLEVDLFNNEGGNLAI